MKKLLALLLSAWMVFSLAACGGKTDPAPSESELPAASQTAAPDAAPQTDPVITEEPSGEELSAWRKSRTGKFYDQFANEMYMEYEMEAGGTVMHVVTATMGDKTYFESKMGDQSLGANIMDDGYLYAIDRASKTVMKMPLQTGGQETVDTMITEEDVDPASFKSGKREIDGKTYDTEEWSVDGASSLLCFDGDRLAYIIGEAEGEETIIKIIKTDSKVDGGLVEIPADYQVISY